MRVPVLAGRGGSGSGLRAIRKAGEANPGAFGVGGAHMTESGVRLHADLVRSCLETGAALPTGACEN